MKLFWVVLIFAQRFAFSISYTPLSLINDDFCDSEDGSDETHTSACSHIANITFTCSPDQPNRFDIPASRINDGVCDCCDGGDEVNSPFKPNCLNTCDNDLALQKENALAWHRTVQAGIQTRSELFEALKRRKRSEEKSYEALKSERQELIKMTKKMRYLLAKESVREKEQRLQLLRERESHCGDGSERACDYFSSTYHMDDEIVSEGYPLELLDKKIKLQSEYSGRELEYVNKLDIVERVRWALCPSKILLPDDDARVFGKVGEYLNHMRTSAAKVAASTRRTKVALRKHTLFGKFLDNGDAGVELAGIVASEWLGLLLSPVILTADYANRGYRYAAHSVWTQIKHFASRDVTGIENSSAVTDVIAVHFVRACQWIASVDTEGSDAANLLLYLDYTTYSGLMSYLDAAAELFRSQLWAYEIAVRSPYMYYDYYVLRKYEQLPPSRKPCLLRSGIEQAQKAVVELDARIQAEDDLRALLLSAAAREEDDEDKDANSHGRGRGGKWSNKDQKKKRRTKAKSRPTDFRKPLIIDYGVDGAFETVKDTCVSKQMGGYEYSFCFFKGITQNKHTSLGTFTSWGPPPAGYNEVKRGSPVAASGGRNEPSIWESVVDTWGEVFDTVSSRVADIGTTLYDMISAADGLAVSVSREPVPGQTRILDIFPKSLVYWLGNTTASVGSTAQGLYNTAVSGKSAATAATNSVTSTMNREQLDTHYSQQFYSDGTPCQTRPGFNRRAVVSLVCDVRNDFVDLVEVEVCSYRLVVSTPLVCSKLLEDRSLAELDRLGVFGFTSNSSRTSSTNGGNAGGGSNNAQGSRKIKTKGSSSSTSSEL